MVDRIDKKGETIFYLSFKSCVYYQSVSLYENNSTTVSFNVLFYIHNKYDIFK
jgi:hypothetical protein